MLPALLVDGAQRQQRTIEGQAGVIAEQREMIAALASRLEQVEQKLVAAPAGTGR